MARTVEILLTENVDNLGIVGDVVTVRPGYARNYLLPSGRAIPPSAEAVKDLAARRAEAEKEMLRLKEMRTEMVAKLEGVEITLERSCNDQGLLYGSVTQRDIAAALDTEGYPVRPRDVRLPNAIKRIDTYDVLIKFDAELSSTIKVWVIADRPLETDEDREEMEFDDEGNLIVKPVKPAVSTPSAADSEAPVPAAPAEG